MNKTLIVALGLFFLLLVGTATGGHAPRLKLKSGMTKTQVLNQLERELDQEIGYSNVHCWLYQGTIKIGWRHGACAGTFTHAGTAYRIKLIRTPVSCSRLRQVVTLDGVRVDNSLVPWPHRIFVCG
jgi:hypothetical protein